MKFIAKWLAAPIELAPMPLMGTAEVKKVEKEGAEAISVGHAYVVAAFHQAVVAAEKLCKVYGPAKAKMAWDDFAVATLSQIGDPRHFIWPEAEFEANLKETKEKYLHLQFAVVNDDELALALTREATELAERAKKVPKEATERLVLRPLLIFYWRLRASGVKEIITATGPVKMDWSLQPANKQAALDLLSEVLDEDDLAALSPQGAPQRLLDMEDLKPMTASDAEGKSSPTSEPSTPSKPDSEPSSAAIAGPGKLEIARVNP